MGHIILFRQTHKRQNRACACSCGCKSHAHAMCVNAYLLKTKSCEQKALILRSESIPNNVSNQKQNYIGMHFHRRILHAANVSNCLDMPICWLVSAFGQQHILRVFFLLLCWVVTFTHKPTNIFNFNQLEQKSAMNQVIRLSPKYACQELK